MYARKPYPAKLETKAEVAAWYVERAVRQHGDCLHVAGRVASGSPRVMWRGRSMPLAALIVEAELGRELKRGRHSEREEVQRSCGNVECINPEHLSVGDRKATTERSSESQRGSAPVVLTEAQRAELRERYEAGEGSQRDLAGEFGVSWLTAHLVIKSG